MLYEEADDVRLACEVEERLAKEEDLPAWADVRSELAALQEIQEL